MRGKSVVLAQNYMPSPKYYLVLVPVNLYGRRHAEKTLRYSDRYNKAANLSENAHVLFVDPEQLASSQDRISLFASSSTEHRTPTPSPTPAPLHSLFFGSKMTV